MIHSLVFIYIAPAIILGAYASLFLKKGSEKFTLNPKKIFDNLYIGIGIFLYICSMAFYILALKHADLSIVYPLTSFSYALVALLSVKHLGEKMNKYKWLGIFFIILGSALIVL